MNRANAISNPLRTRSESHPRHSSAVLAGTTLFGPIEALAIMELAALSIAVFLHSLQLEDLSAYRNSLLIPIEIFGLLGAFLLVPILLIRAIYLLLCRRFLIAIVNVFICVTAVGVAIWAMWFDSPTLIYMT